MDCLLNAAGLPACQCPCQPADAPACTQPAPWAPLRLPSHTAHSPASQPASHNTNSGTQTYTHSQEAVLHDGQLLILGGEDGGPPLKPRLPPVAAQQLPGPAMEGGHGGALSPRHIPPQPLLKLCLCLAAECEHQQLLGFHPLQQRRQGHARQVAGAGGLKWPGALATGSARGRPGAPPQARTCSSIHRTRWLMVVVFPVPAAASTQTAWSSGACTTANCSALRATAAGAVGGGGEATAEPRASITIVRMSAMYGVSGATAGGQEGRRGAPPAPDRSQQRWPGAS